MRSDKPTIQKDFEERVLEIKRVSRTVAGGKRMRFRALVVIGNRKGKIGLAVAKGKDVQEAIQKAVRSAKKRLVSVSIVNDSIAHEVTLKLGSAKIIFKPAPAGTSIIAGGAIRPVIELSGIKNIVAKIIGSTNKINTAMATIEMLKKLSRAKKLPSIKAADLNDGEQQ